MEVVVKQPASTSLSPKTLPDVIQVHLPDGMVAEVTIDSDVTAADVLEDVCEVCVHVYYCLQLL